MTRWILGWVASAVALLLVAYFVPGFRVTGFAGAMLAAVGIGFVNATLGAFVKLVTTPLRWLTLGLLTLVINAAMLLVADYFVDNLSIDSFFAAFVGSILLSILATALRSLIPDGKTKD